MPYTNVPAGQTAKMDRCVTKVQARGKPKKRAIAICYSSIVGKESDMSNSRKNRRDMKFRKEKLEKEAEERGETLGLVGTVPTEVQQEQVIEPVEEVMEAELTPEEEAIVEEVMDEIDEEDQNPEENEEDEEDEEDDDGEEKEVRIEEKEVISVFEKFWNFIKSKFDKPDEKKESMNPFQIFKDKKGDYRYVAIVSNNFMDRDYDILTDKAHKEFMEHLDAHPEQAPELWIWHTPGTAHKHRADFWEYENGFVMYSGKLTEEEALRAQKAAGYAELGMSHGMNIFPAYIVLERDEQAKHLITKYRTFEISYLPLSNVSNPWTAWSVIQKEVETMKDEKKKFLVEALGAEVAEALIADTGKAKQVLDALGIASKETTETPQTQPVAQLDVEAIVKAVADKFGMEQLSEVIKNLVTSVDQLKADKEQTQKVLAELTKTDDEKIAEQIQVTPSNMYAWMEKAMSQSDKTVVPETDPIVQQTPRPSWISEAIK